MVENDKVLEILQRAVALLEPVEGIVGVALGGSRARGNHREDSDIDIGIYYDGDNPPDIEMLCEIAGTLDDAHREKLVVDYGEWGDWVNAGGWLIVDGYHVDLILREMQRVTQVLADCQTGYITAHYQPGHPHAYVSAMYVGELAHCKILSDRTGALEKLYRKAQQYPPRMKEAMIRFFMFEASFSHQFALDTVARNDPYYLAAQMMRSISCLNQVLFALNETYCINEKKAVRMIDALAVKPEGYSRRVEEIVALSCALPLRACEEMAALIDEVKTLCAQG